jgi:hypothetical protein
MSAERIYDLLPTIVKLRDAGSGWTLRALMQTIQEQADRISDDLDTLYDDWFIETCRDWVVPYIGELVSARSHYAFGAGAQSLRAFVADTLHFRRRKGTASMLEDLATSVTGWSCRAVEMFQELATTQNVNHVRPGNTWTPDLRNTEALERIDGAFDPSNRTIDVRSIASGRGRYNVPDVALFLWRLLALEASVATTAARADATGGGRFRFDPLGADRAIFNPARTPGSLDERVTEAEVPAPARRRPIFDELNAARAAITAGTSPVYQYLASGSAVVTIQPVGEAAPIPPEQIQICNLDGWATLPTPTTVTRHDGSTFTTRVAVDPVTGRFAFLDGTSAAVKVGYYAGAAAAIGGGTYPRGPFAAADQAIAMTDWTQPSSPSLTAALGAWNPASSKTFAIEIGDSGSYDAPVTPLVVPAGASLTIRSKAGERAVIRAGAPWQVTLAAGATLALDGIWLVGAPLVLTVSAASGSTATLALRHVTLVPGVAQDTTGAPTAAGTVMLATAAGSTGQLAIDAELCVLGRVDVTAGDATFLSTATITDSVIDDAVDDTEIIPDEALRAHALTVIRSTVLGATHARSLDASDSIFQRVVTVERTQEGCVRFSFVPDGSKVPRTFRCQPALALAAPGADAAVVLTTIVPAFTSITYGDAAYPQLALTTPIEIRAGGSDGSEMGVHFQLHQPQREANLRLGLDEYLRFGLEAGLVFVS